MPAPTPTLDALVVIRRPNPRRGTGPLVVLLRPPRYVWPFNRESSAFWPPLGFLSLAGALRRELPELRVEIWDCPGERCGWRTLERRLAEEPVAVLGLGEETVSAMEALRAATLVRRLWPDCRIVAGGVHFAHDLRGTLATGLVDVIVRGEGERTFVELLRRLEAPGEWQQVPGLAFGAPDGEPVLTAPAPLIADLDTLPEPAHDLIDLGQYGRGSRNHPALVSIEHSRGCIDSCAFCILWRHMGREDNGTGSPRPCLRSKSPERSFAEVERLHRQEGRRTFGWVDPTFNASPAWSDRWSELMLASDLVQSRGRARTLHTAWVRADCIVRDHELGILEKLVRAGLRQVMIGVERDSPAGLAALGKHGTDPDTCRRAFAILREYPRVFAIGTLIYGLPGDTMADLRRLSRRVHQWGMDYCFLMPLTPLPGTDVALQAREQALVSSEDLSTYDFHTPVCRTASLGCREQERLYWKLMLDGNGARLRHLARQLLGERDPRKRRVHRALFWRGTRLALGTLTRSLLRPGESTPSRHSRRPTWYES